MMGRQKLTDLSDELKKCGVSLGRTASGHLVLRNDKNKNILFTVGCDDVFDADGMRFEDDMEIY